MDQMFNPQIDLTTKTAFVTGASRGIGLAIARSLAGYGATVILAARSSDKIDHEAALIRADGGSAHAVACDVSDYETVLASVEKALSLVEKIDVLVNNAGVIDPLAHLIDSDPAEWAKAVVVKLKGVYVCMRAILPGMVNSGGGTVINMSSGAANSDLVGWSHYCSTKAAAKKITEVAHNELTPHGIRVIGISPGTVATDMMAKIRESQINVVSDLDWGSHIPPEWVGEAVAYLCGPEALEFAGKDFSLKTPLGRARVGLPAEGATDG